MSEAPQEFPIISDDEYRRREGITPEIEEIHDNPDTRRQAASIESLIGSLELMASATLPDESQEEIFDKTVDKLLEIIYQNINQLEDYLIPYFSKFKDKSERDLKNFQQAREALTILEEAENEYVREIKSEEWKALTFEQRITKIKSILGSNLQQVFSEVHKLAEL